MKQLGYYDMNLLRIFVLVYETRSVTKAAELLVVSQPSVSFALSKLRRLFADPLFNRTAAGLEPTPVAAALYPEVREAVHTLDSAVRGAAEFDPAEPNRFRLMMTDLGLMALFPYIVGAVGAVSPESSIEVIPLDTDLLRDGLARNEIDAAVGIPLIPDGDLNADHLMDMPYVGVCSQAHPRISAEPTLAELAAEGQVVVSRALGHEHVSRRLVELGMGSSIRITLPHFAVVAQTLAVTECVSVVPRALADLFEATGAVRQFRLPFRVEPGRVRAYTYRRRIPSPRIEWLRQTIRTSLEEYPYPKHVAGNEG